MLTAAPHRLALLIAVLMIPALANAARPSLSATLVDPEAKAKTRTVTVQVEVTGIELVDSPSGQPRDGQGHLHYRVDDGPTIATTVEKLSFHDLSTGRHRLEIRIVGNDHKPLGPVEHLEVTIPAGAPVE